VHKKLLCDRCSYFAGAFNTSFQEAFESVVRFPEDDPDAMAALIDFIYRGVIPEGPTDDPTEAEKNNYFTTLAKSYVLAEKLCFEQFMNRLLENYLQADIPLTAITTTTNRHYALSEVVDYIYTNTHSNSRLRRLVATEAATHLNCIDVPQNFANHG
jgi:hypothetical protein